MKYVSSAVLVMMVIFTGDLCILALFFTYGAIMKLLNLSFHCRTLSLISIYILKEYVSS